MPQTSPIHPHHQQKLPQQHQWRLHQHSSGALALERVGELPPPSARRHGKQTDKSPIAELGSLIGEKVGDFIRYQQTAGMGSNPRGHSFRGHHGGQQHGQPEQVAQYGFHPSQQTHTTPPPPWQHQQNEQQHLAPPWKQQALNSRRHEQAHASRSDLTGGWLLRPTNVALAPPPWQRQQQQLQAKSQVPRQEELQREQQPTYPIGAPNRVPGQQYGYGAQYQFPTEIVPPSGSKMSTKVDIGDLTERDEVDITFMPGPIGMRLDERGGLLPVSVVTNLVPNGQAALAGVEIGCIVMGINGERWAKNVRCSPASISLSSLCALKLSFSQVYQSCPHHLYAQARQEANKNEVSLWGLTHRCVDFFTVERYHFISMRIQRTAEEAILCGRNAQARSMGIFSWVRGQVRKWLWLSERHRGAMRLGALGRVIFAEVCMEVCVFGQAALSPLYSQCP